MSIAQITIGAVLIITGVGAGIGAMMMLGGVLGLVSDELSAVLGGLGTAANGLNCLLMGLQLFTCGPVGWVAGTALVITGAATMAFGVNDILTVATGRNFIQELTGMSDQAYFWANLGLNIASTVFTIAGSIGKLKFDQNVAKRQQAAIVKEGQKHHVISNSIKREMIKNENLKYIDRDATLVQAITKDGHRGYQKWHREYDIMVVEYLKKNSKIDLLKFEKYINKIYSEGDLHKIFGDVIIKFITKK